MTVARPSQHQSDLFVHTEPLLLVIVAKKDKMQATSSFGAYSTSNERLLSRIFKDKQPSRRRRASRRAGESDTPSIRLCLVHSTPFLRIILAVFFVSNAPSGDLKAIKNSTCQMPRSLSFVYAPPARYHSPDPPARRTSAVAIRGRCVETRPSLSLAQFLRSGTTILAPRQP